MELSTSVGVAEFRLLPEFRFLLTHGSVLPPGEGRPFTLLDDGTEVRLFDADERSYMLIDYRRDPDIPAYVEFWECTRAPETSLAGLWAICEARPQAV